MITIEKVKTKSQRKAFVNFPLKLYKGNPYFVPPLYGDEMRVFRDDYHYYEQAEAVYYLAYRDGKVVGRISGILHHASNRKWNQRRVRFTRFDCIDDGEVAHALFTAVEDWAKAQGMEEVVGPLGFSDLEREGLLIEGFEELSTFEEQYNYPYYQKLIEENGYAKEADWVEYKLYLPDTIDERYGRVGQRVLERFHLRFGDAKDTDDFLKKYSDLFLDLLDETYSGLYGTVPFTPAMKRELIKSFRQIIDLRFVRIILDENGRPVCAGLCFPAIGEALQPSGGKLTLPTLFRILKAVKKPKVLDLGLIGVIPEYHMKGVSSVLLWELICMMRDAGIDHCETNLMLEDNFNIQNQWKVFSTQQHKRRRSFLKKL